MFEHLNGLGLGTIEALIEVRNINYYEANLAPGRPFTDDECVRLFDAVMNYDEVPHGSRCVGGREGARERSLKGEQ